MKFDSKDMFGTVSWTDQSERKRYMRGDVTYTKAEILAGKMPSILTDMMERSKPRKDGSITITFLVYQPVYPGQHEWKPEGKS